MTTAELTAAPRTARERLATWVESDGVQRIVLGLIVLNAVVLGLETSPSLREHFGHVISAVDRFCLGVFALEISLKLAGRGPRFFARAWNVFDLVVVGVSLVPAAGVFSVLRALRVLRTFRLFSGTKQMRRVIETLVRSLPGMASIAMIMTVVYFVTGVVATHLFGARFPEFFGSMGRSLFTLFQVMTLEAWGEGIARPVIAAYPYAWMFFVPFILATTFTMLNLVVALITSSMGEQVAEEAKDSNAAAAAAAASSGPDVAGELAAVRAELQEIKRLLSQRDGGVP